jgi:hypothetical protein
MGSMECYVCMYVCMNITLHNPAEAHRCFKVLFAACFLLSLLLDTDYEVGSYVPPRLLLTYTASNSIKQDSLIWKIMFVFIFLLSEVHLETCCNLFVFRKRPFHTHKKKDALVCILTLTRNPIPKRLFQFP